MSSVCALPWMSLETTALGEYRPCCLAEESITKPDGTMYRVANGDTIQDAFNSDYMDKLRGDFVAGKKPDTCKKCWALESAGGYSKRMISNDKFGKYKGKKLRFLDLKLGNICNLKCRICGVWSSSKWAQEEIDLGNKDAKKFLEAGQWPRQKHNLWSEVIELLPDVEYFEFTGGEPFLIKEHFDLLEQSVQLGHSKNQVVHYNTNGTTYPKHAIKNIWPHFKLVEVAFSIDDIGARFEYQRYGAVWEHVNENIDKINNLRSSTPIKTQVCCTINVQNIWNMPEICEWIESKNFDYIYFNYLHESKEWNVQYLPNNYKQKIQNKLLSSTMSINMRKEIGKAVNFMMDNNLNTPQMDWQRKVKIKASDEYRNQSFVNVHPEYQGML